jgi:hypothetical protein
MSKTKAQKAAEERASKKATTEVKPATVAEPPKPTPAPAQPVAVSKQQMTIMKLTAALREQRQIEVKPEMLIADGKYINLLIGKEWPVIAIGPTGGIVLPVIKSYPKAFEAALDGDKLLAKQNEREAKKAAAAAPTAPAAKCEQKQVTA